MHIAQVLQSHYKIVAVTRALTFKWEDNELQFSRNFLRHAHASTTPMPPPRGDAAVREATDGPSTVYHHNAFLTWVYQARHLITPGTKEQF